MLNQLEYYRINESRIMRETAGYTIDLPDHVDSQLVYSDRILDNKSRTLTEAL